MKALFYTIVIIFCSAAHAQNPKIGSRIAISSDDIFTEADIKSMRESISNYTRGIKDSQNLEFYYANRGLLYYRLKEYTAAIADLSVAMEMSPDKSEYYILRGHCKKGSNKTFKISYCEDYQKAKKLNPEKIVLGNFAKECEL
jgi:tetratricopeptide (TPR) repeat protein